MEGVLFTPILYIEKLRYTGNLPRVTLWMIVELDLNPERSGTVISSKEYGVT